MKEKTCTKCHLTKPVTEFSRANGNGFRGDCKQCKNLYSKSKYTSINTNKSPKEVPEKSYYEKNREKILVNSKNYYEKNKLTIVPKRQKRKESMTDEDRFNAYVSWRNWYDLNKERICQNNKIHYEKNRDKYNSRQNERRALKLRAVPPWVDKDEIRALYSKAKELTESTGILHVVDHIIPLRGKNVTGLHVHTNLRVITWEENAAKSNKFVESLIN